MSTMKSSTVKFCLEDWQHTEIVTTLKISILTTNLGIIFGLFGEYYYIHWKSFRQVVQELCRLKFGKLKHNSKTTLRE